MRNPETTATPAACATKPTVREMISARIWALAVDDDGMSTVEYAIGTIAAAAFGAILYTVVTGDSVVSALTGIINRALSVRI